MLAKSLFSRYFQHMNDIYNKRRDAEDLWEIFDIWTGKVVILEGGYPLSGLDDHEVREALDLLDAGELVPVSDDRAA